MTPTRRKLTADRKFVLYAVLGTLLLILGVAAFAPAEQEDDPTPSTYNAGPQGAKAAFLLLPRLRYRVERSSDAFEQLAGRDATHTTLFIAAPHGSSTREQTDTLDAFLRRGGRIVATGDYGADVLPGVYWHSYDEMRNVDRCRTSPEGDSEFARVGPLTFTPGLLARTDLAETHVAQRCEGGAAVIWYRIGAGTVVWWAGVDPLTNRGLHTDANLQLLLASIGDRDRTVLFDESEHPWQPVSPWSKLAGVPVRTMLLQLLLAFFFVLLAYSRRLGPLRSLQTTPRTSPLEFAESMGALYQRAGAGEVATEQARRELLQLLQQQGGLSRETVRGPADGIATTVEERFGFHDPELTPLLIASSDTARLAPARALPIVRALHRITDQLQQRFRRTPGRTPTGTPQEKTQ